MVKERKKIKKRQKKKFMMEFSLNFNQGLLLSLKWKIEKNGRVNEELMREWSEKVTDSTVMDGLVKEEEII